MDRAEFDDLVQSIEERFHGRLDALARNAWLWLFAGHVVVILGTLLSIAAGIALFTLCFVLDPFYAVWLVIGGAGLIALGLLLGLSLLVFDLPVPEGRRLAPNEAPELQSVIRRIQTELDCEPIHEIILTDNFNASVVQHPRLGFFGWSKSWLMIGMPLLMAVSPEEMRAVLAHECAHLSRRHSRHGNRIYHLHRTWEQLYAEVQKQSAATTMRALRFVMRKFLEWYWPRFHARAFVLSRQQEFEADKLAAQNTTAETMATALWRIDCTGYFLGEQFWKLLWRHAAELQQPPDDLCERMIASFNEAPHSPSASRWRNDAFSRAPDNSDSHPSLSQRIAALGQPVEAFRARPFPSPPVPSAADALLTADLVSLRREVNQHWSQTASASWCDRHRRATLLHRFAEGEEASTDTTSLSSVQLWDRIKQVGNTKGLDDAEPLIRRLLAIQPDHVGATYVLATHRLSDAPEEGEVLLRHVFEMRDKEWSHAAGVALEQFYLKVGREAQLRQIREQLDQLEKNRVAAQKELTDFRPSNTFVAHELTEADLAPLLAVLSKQQNCANAWLARKQLKYAPKEKLFVLCVDSAATRSKERQELNEKLTTSLLVTAQLPGRVFVINPTGEFRAVANRIMRSPGSQIFDRTQLGQLDRSTLCT